MTGRGGTMYPVKGASNKRQRQGEEYQRRRIRTSNFKSQHGRNADAELRQLGGGGLQPRDLGILGERPAAPRGRDPWIREVEPYPAAQLGEMLSVTGWPGAISFGEVGILDGGNAPLFVEQEQVLPQVWPTNPWSEREMLSGQPTLHANEKGLLGRAPATGSNRSERTLVGYSGGKDGRVFEWEQYPHRMGSQPTEHGILGEGPARPMSEHGMSISGATRFWEQGLLGKRPISEDLPSFPDPLQGRSFDQERWERYQDHDFSLRASDVMLQPQVARLYADPEHMLGARKVTFQAAPGRERFIDGRRTRPGGMSDTAFRTQSNGRSSRGTALHQGLLGRVPLMTDVDTP